MALSDWFSPASWYDSAIAAGSSAFDKGQALVSGLWGAPDAASPGVQSGELFPSPVPLPKPAPTWDQTPWYSKLWAYATDVVPGAVGDTVGVTQRPGAVTVGDTVSTAVNTVKGAVSSPTFLIIIVAVAALAFLGILVAVKK
jgi:hypothetical protein